MTGKMADPAKTRGGAPESIGEIIPVWRQLEFLEKILEERRATWTYILPRVIKITGQDACSAHWWPEVIRIFTNENRGRSVSYRVAHDHGLGVFFSAIHYAEMCADAEHRARKGLGILDNPGGYIASKVMAYARRQGIALPENPLSPSWRP